jgi:hypothetical protein
MTDTNPTGPDAVPPPPPGPGFGAAPGGMPGAAGGRGPIGKQRPIGMSLLLIFVTCGIWFLLLIYQNHEEMKQYNGQGLGGGLALVIAVVFGLASPFLMNSEIEKLHAMDGEQSPVKVADAAWILIPIVGIFIWFPKAQGALNDFWGRRGAPAPG